MQPQKFNAEGQFISIRRETHSNNQFVVKNEIPVYQRNAHGRAF